VIEPRKHQAIDIADGYPLGRPTPQHIEKPVQTGQAIIVLDKTFAGTIEGIAANGQPYHQVLVFDRQ
jgi:hypothetical protein